MKTLMAIDNRVMRDLCETIDTESAKGKSPNWDKLRTKLTEVIIKHVEEMSHGEKCQRLTHMYWKGFCDLLEESAPEAKQHLWEDRKAEPKKAKVKGGIR